MTTEQSIAALEETARAGVSESAFQLGVAYAHGFGVKQDFSVAASWFYQAATAGHPAAQDRLGICYATGQGVEQSDTEAVRWFRQAAEAGNSGAQFNLGLALILGQGIEVNPVEAYVWFSMSAAQGDLVAMESRTRVAEQLTGRELLKANDQVRHWMQKTMRDL